jgi:tRNA nucleotidyltransferase (CCA-adding enzyme)
MKMEKILSNVLQKISLNSDEIKKIEKETKELIKILKKNKLNANIGGSLAKGTILKKDNQDVDIFVVLKPEELPKFEKIIAKTKLKYEIIHGSRDYLQIKKENITFELIPVLKLDKKLKIENITDFSLVHVKYIKSKIEKNKKLANEIKLAKAFCHANKCYGAESYIGGFSGYALEVLVCYYGSFFKLLKKISSEIVIDPEKQFKNKNEIMRELNQSKLQSPLILIDPTYKYRNVCAGLTKEIYDLFLQKSSEFLRNPSEEFFQKKEFNLNNFKESAKKENLNLYKLDIKTDRQEGDIAGTKMKKLFKFLIRELEKKEQRVVFNEFVYRQGKESEGYLAIKPKEVIEIIGPKPEMEKAAEEFKKVRKTIYLSRGNLCAKEKVSIENIFINSTYIAESMGTGFSFEKLI